MVFKNKYLILIALVILSLNTFATVNVTSGGSLNLCVGAPYTTIGKITIAEGANNDFSISPNVKTYEINAPSNFEFNPGNGSVLANGGDIKFSALTVTATKITLYYQVTTTSSSDRFELTNIQIRATNPSGSQNLVRTGGDAEQLGNNNGDNKVHAQVVANQANVNLSASAKIVCANASDINLNGNPSGGAYIGSSAIVGSLFKPSLANPGSYVISYTVNNNGCSGTDTVHITVKAIPNVTFFGLANSYCNNDSAQVLTGFPSGGTFSGLGMSSSGTFRPTLLSPGTTSVSYSYKDPVTNCINVSTKSGVTILQAPTLTITLSPNQSVYQTTTPFVNITAVSSNPSAGGQIHFYGNGVSDINKQFIPSAAGEGTFDITGTFKAPNGCTVSSLKKVTVASSNNVNIIGLSTKYCEGEAISDLSTNNGAGTFSGPGIYDENIAVGTAKFDPGRVSFKGSDTTVVIRYQYILSNLGLGEEFDKTEEVRIYKKPIVLLQQDDALNSTNFKKVFCTNDSIVSLNAIVSPLGGTLSYSGSGVSNSLFNPHAANVGDNTITVNYTDMNNCSNSDSKVTKIIDIPQNISITNSLLSTYCENQPVQPISGIPAGGTFSAVIGVLGNTFNPITAATAIEPDDKNVTIKVRYTVTTNGCSNYAERNVIINKLPEVHLNGLNSAYCSSDLEVALAGTPTGGASIYTISSDDVIIQPNTTLVGNTFFPSLATPATYKIVYTYKDPSTQCSNSETKATVVRRIPNPNFTNLDTSYCSLNNTLVTMNGSPVDDRGTYTSIGNTASVANGIFNVDASGVGKHTVVFTYTDEFGCAASVARSTTVYGSPQTKSGVKTPVRLSTVCADDFITLRDNNSTITTKPQAFSFIKTASWLVDTTQIIKEYLEEPIVQLSAGNHKIFYKLITDKGCSTTFDTTISIGSYPKANFTWDEICNNQNTKFQNTTPSLLVGKVNKIIWNFSDPDKPANDTINITNTVNGNTSHTYDNARAYEVFMTAHSDYKCVTTTSKNIFILASKKVTISEPYFNDFNNLVGDWVAATAIDTIPSSWVLNTPDKKYIKGNNGAWFTGLKKAFTPDEKSYVYSPCFTIDNTITKPMIHLDVFSMTNLNASGANLQYSTNGKDWKPLGKRNETGINWYNNTGNIAARPSGSELDQDGWTGLDSTGKWKNARHIFDDVLQTGRNIRFRISFAGNKDTTDGFAFDNVWVGERTRLILVEHYTNNSSNNTKNENAVLNTLINNNQTNGNPKDIVAIQYHTAFPGVDPMYSRNVSDAGARSLYYGVTQVPYSVVDGSYYKGNTLGIKQATIDTRSLYDPAFELDLNASLNATTVSGSVVIKNKIPVGNNVTVYISVLERHVNNVTGSNGETEYEWVHAKFLPDAAGKSFSGNWSSNRTETIPFSWTFTSSNIYNREKLAVIVFAQNNVTKEIYQAAYKGLGADVVTSVFNPNEQTSTVMLYPNPANNMLNVILSGTLAGDYSWAVVDGLGRIVDQGIASDQADGFVINTQQYADGFYTLRLSNSSDGVKTQKFVVVH